MIKKKLEGFHKWQLATFGGACIGAFVAVIGGFTDSGLMISLGISIAILCVLSLVMLFSRQTWRQLKKIDSKVNSASLEAPAPIYIERESGRNGAEVAGIPRVGLDAEWARRMPEIRANMETFALRSKSLRVRDSIALSATNGKYKYPELRQVLTLADMGIIERARMESIRSWDPQMLLTLARLAANQQATENDLQDSARIFSTVERYFGAKTLGRTDRLTFVESLSELGDSRAQREAIKRFGISNKFPIQGALLRLNAVARVDGEISDRWLTQLNEMYLKHGFSEVSLKNDSESKPLDRLVSKTGSKIDGPLVSVLVPSYRGGELLRTALDSLLQQTWNNLEIIVIDDCSGPEYDEILTALPQMDPKVQVIRQPKNLGAYSARNAGLAIARGEFITVHDDDDWSHPDKIAIQVQHLIDNPDSVANMSLHARSTDDLKFLRINNNPQFAQPNFSSLMVRRRVFDDVGPWDNVNRGADAEFRDRLVTKYGSKIESVGKVPLSFTRTREGSLTAGEMSRGYVDPSRLLYLASYTKWHSSLKENLEALNRGTERQYPVPSTMEAGMRGGDLGTFDVVYVTDFRFPGGTTSLTLSEMKAVSKAGKRVGFIHLESPLNSFKSSINPTLFSYQEQGLVEQLSLNDVAHVKTLLVRHPSVVTFLDRATAKISVDIALLIVNNPPVNKGGSGMVFDLEVCIENMDRIFKVRTDVIGESDLTRRLSVPLVPNSRILEITWPGVITSDSVPNPDFSMLPVLGRHSRDHSLKWPSRATDFLKVYSSDKYETRILGGVSELRKKLGNDVTDGIQVYEFGALEVDSFLADVDFWAYFHDDKLTESFGMSAAEAMAAGKVVILPSYMQSTFGNGALYAKPEEVPELISRVWSDPEAYLKQSELAREFISANYGVDALLERLSKFANEDPNEV